MDGGEEGNMGLERRKVGEMYKPKEWEGRRGSNGMRR